LPHRLGLEDHKPDVIPRGLDEAKQKAFIESYDKLLNSLVDNEAVPFEDAGRIQPMPRAGCFAPSQEKLAIEQTSGRQRINIHGAIDLETGQPSAIAYHDRSARMIETMTIDAASTIKHLESIAGALSDARAHPCLSRQRALSSCQARAGMARAARPPDQVHFIPPYCPHLNPIERPWSLMH
jgi:hypothetical protein